MANSAQAELTLKVSSADHQIAWLAALAITIHIAESVIPSPIPGIKPGLANVITIAVLCRFGLAAAIWVSLLRVIVGSLFIGSFLTPTFLLSLSGALASLAVLAIATQLPGKGFGPVGYGLLAAMAHMGAQFFTAYFFFIPHQGLFYLLPIFMTAAVIFGLLSGTIAKSMLAAIDKKSADECHNT